MKKVEIATGLVMLALAGVIVLGTRDLPYWVEYAPGAGFAPFWVAAVTAVLSLGLIAQAARRQTSAPTDWPDSGGFARVWLIIGGLWLVVALAGIFGLIPMVVAFVAFMLIVVLRCPLLPSLVTTAIIAALVYGVFIVWLDVSVPLGIFGI